MHPQHRRTRPATHPRPRRPLRAPPGPRRPTATTPPAHRHLPARGVPMSVLGPTTPVPATRAVPDQKRLLRAEELAERWQVEKSHVYRLTRDGAIPAVKLGRYYRYR